MMKLFGVFLAVLTIINGVVGYRSYQKQIPNGKNNVQSPCDGSKWPGVGHWVSGGGGDRNPFGDDFVRQGRKWTNALCKMDSDGDGRSNGEELGDPHCIWQEGHTPTRVSDITHPGLCDPIFSQTCLKLFNKDNKMDVCKALQRTTTTTTRKPTNKTTASTRAPTRLSTLRPDPTFIIGSASRSYISPSLVMAIALALFVRFF